MKNIFTQILKLEKAVKEKKTFVPSKEVEKLQKETETNLKNLMTRFASVNKKILDWYGVK